MPGALPRIDVAARGRLHPLQFGAEAAVADPLRPPLEPPAAPAALDEQSPRARALPVRPVEPVPLRHRARHAGGQIRRGAPRGSPGPTHMLETGGTTGPGTTRPTPPPAPRRADPPAGGPPPPTSAPSPR